MKQKVKQGKEELVLDWTKQGKNPKDNQTYILNLYNPFSSPFKLKKTPCNLLVVALFVGVRFA